MVTTVRKETKARMREWGNWHLMRWLGKTSWWDGAGAESTEGSLRAMQVLGEHQGRWRKQKSRSPEAGSCRLCLKSRRVDEKAGVARAKGWVRRLQNWWVESLHPVSLCKESVFYLEWEGKQPCKASEHRSDVIWLPLSRGHPTYSVKIVCRGQQSQLEAS